MTNNKESNFVSAVIYVYNKEHEIYEILNKIRSIFKNNFKKYEIICVNDASTDNSTQQIEEFAKTMKEGSLTVINMSYYQGIERAMNAGIDASIGDYVYEFDDINYDYDEEIVLKVYNKCLSGFDIVSASYEKNRNKASTLFYRMFNKYSDLQYDIRTENFRIVSRRAVNRVQSINKNITYRKAVYANCGFKISNIIYNSRKTLNNTFNKTVHETRKKLAIDSLLLFTDIMYRFSITMSIIMVLITIFVGIYTVTVFISKNPVDGWTTTMLFLSVGFLGTFIMMTSIIKYLEILLNITFKDNRYIIESIDKLN